MRSNVSAKPAATGSVDAYAAKYAWNMDDFNEPIYAVRPSVAFAYSSAPGEFTGGATKWTFG